MKQKGYFRIFVWVGIIALGFIVYSILFSCRAWNEYDLEALDYMEEKYQESFRIRSKGSRVWSFYSSAHPELEDIFAYKDPDPDKALFSDTYADVLLLDQTEKYFVKNFREKWREFPHYLRVGAHYNGYDEKADYTKLLTFEELLEKDPERLSLSLRLAFYTEPKLEVLEKVAELDRKLRPLGLSEVRLSVCFYPGEVVSVEKKEFYRLNRDDTLDAEGNDKFLGKLYYLLDSEKSSLTALELEKLLYHNEEGQPEFSRQANDYVAGVLNRSRFDYLSSTSAHYRGYGKKMDDTQRVEFGELIQEEPEKIDLRLRLAIFARPGNSEVLDEISNLSGDLRSLDLAEVRMDIHFYSPEMVGEQGLEDKKFEDVLTSKFLLDAKEKGHFLGRISYIMEPSPTWSGSLEKYWTDKEELSYRLR